MDRKKDEIKSDNRIDKLNSYLFLARKAIKQLRKEDKKITIASVSKLSGISRKTFYNNPELKQLCEQAKSIQDQKPINPDAKKENIKLTKSLSRINIIENRYLRVKKQLEKAEAKNDALLINNNELVLEKEQLNSKITMLEKKIKRMTDDKVKKLK